MHACTLAIAHACTIAIVHACTVATVHAPGVWSADRQAPQMDREGFGTQIGGRHKGIKRGLERR